MPDRLDEAIANLPAYLGGHMQLVLSGLIISVLIAVPLGIFAARNRTLAGPVLGVASTLQTIPSLALLALMVPILGGRIGFAPAFIALTLYGILPILRNTVVGLQGVDPVVREAARGTGMTPLQSLGQVELPLALPTIIAGLRTATVWIVGTATLATPVGATSLGNYIFSGLQTRDWTTVIFGCLVAAGLALLLDQAIRLAELAARERKRAPAFAGIAIAAVLAMGAALPLVTGTSAARGVGSGEGTVTAGIEGRTVVIGAKGFTEQYILAALLERVLEDAGADVEIRENLGSTIAFDALRSGEIDVYIDYTGTIWATVMEREEGAGRYDMFVRMAGWLREEHGILALGRLGFENAYGYAVRRAWAEDNGIETIGDLSGRGVRVGGDPEFFARAEWLRSRDAYGLQDARTRPMDSTFMYGALRDGEVDAVSAYTTDGRISDYDLLVLDDPFQILPPYDAVMLISPDAARNPALAGTLSVLLNAIPAETMRQANAMVDLEGRTPGETADWLYGEVVAAED